MKKEYVKPELAVEDILLEAMIATSSSFGGEAEDGEEADAGQKRGWGSLWN